MMRQTGGEPTDASTGATPAATPQAASNGLIDSPVQGEVKIIEEKEADNE
jgi:hypothetical protein